MILSSVVLDTNVFISALIFTGKPAQLFELLIEKKYFVVISPTLLAELIDVLKKKFRFNEERLLTVEKDITALCNMVHPKNSLNILKDIADNRVLEAAVEGKCKYIVTGDKQFLKIKKHRGINIITSSEFLKLLQENYAN